MSNIAFKIWLAAAGTKDMSLFILMMLPIVIIIRIIIMSKKEERRSD